MWMKISFVFEVNWSFQAFDHIPCRKNLIKTEKLKNYSSQLGKSFREKRTQENLFLNTVKTQRKLKDELRNRKLKTCAIINVVKIGDEKKELIVQKRW